MPIKNIITQKDQAISVQFANVKNRLQSEFAKHSMYNTLRPEGAENISLGLQVSDLCF